MQVPYTSAAIVTGASSGIGLGVAQTLLQRGYNVVVTSRTICRSQDFTDGPNLVRVEGDIRERANAVAVAAAALEHFDRIDLLVNNAGVFVSKPFTDYTEEDFRHIVDTNVASFFYMTQQVIPAMQRQRSGHVVSISTSLVDQPNVAVPAVMTSLSKGTMPAVSRALAMEYAADNLRFNTISPGVVMTPMHAGGDLEALKNMHPLHRVSGVQEIADAVVYLDSALGITGENLRIDGGMHAGKW